MTSLPLVEIFLKNAEQLRFKNLFFMILGLFFIDLLLPDFVPFIDEIILGLLAIILANLKKDSKKENTGGMIEGEIVNDDEQSN